MIRLVSEDGTLIDPTKVSATTTKKIANAALTVVPALTNEDIARDARRASGMRFLSDAGLTLDDRLLDDDVQSIIDSVLFGNAGQCAA